MAKDKYHEHIIEALIKDGWEITHDPYIIEFDDDDKLKIDLDAQKIIGAEKEGHRIAVEVKSFLNESVIYDYHSALGQMINYQIGIDEIEEERGLFLAMPHEAYEILRTKFVFRKSVEKNELKLILFDVKDKTIVAWKK